MAQGNLFTRIRSICERPRMYAPEFSLDHLLLFIQGYESALRDLGHPSQHGRFEDWIYSTRSAWRSSSLWWGRHVLEECGGDLELALSEIIRLVEQFLSSNGGAGFRDSPPAAS